ncbi:MAG TPA: STAS domain-containing protein [Verrucomicrobiae bacterium]
MTRTGPALCVAVVEHTAFVKVPGRANYASSIDLKNLVGELRQRGFSEFILDLRECMTMDSTFLGVLAGLVLRNGHPEPEAPTIELLNPNSRVLDLIENLGVLSMFRVKNEDAPSTLMFEPTNDHPEPTKEEVTRNCLEAHRTLMKINPANVPKFKEVTQFMAEDLKKLSNGK